jgi:hypothetical protein
MLQGLKKYIQLTFNSYISDDDFYSKVYAYYRHKLVFFSGDDQCQNGVHIMDEWALCNPNDG